MEPATSSTSKIIVISGPAGSGKTTLCDRLMDTHDSVVRMVTTTSRSPRPGENDGVDYHFLSPEEFKARIEQGDFVEWALVHGRYYGSQKKHLLDQLNLGKDILLNIDVQGAAAFREKAAKDEAFHGKVISIFIQPQSLEQIKERLFGRGTDDDAEIERRLHSAKAEMLEAEKFDHVILSHSKEEDFSELQTIYASIRHLQ